ncbi:putative RNA-directed DNA polymerase from transposon X-element [Trichonephila clavipes]|nr:putative RNA-directed DNA polymerase from transposon X-element [Trichonephila clavipes]
MHKTYRSKAQVLFVRSHQARENHLHHPPPPKVNFWEQRAKNSTPPQQPNPSTSKSRPKPHLHLPFFRRPETTAIQLIRQNDHPITIVSAYRPPRKPISEQDLHRIFRNQGYVLVAGDLNAKNVSWSPHTQQNVAGNLIRRFCDSTGYSLAAPPEPTYFHRNTRSTTIDIAICKGMTVTDCSSIPELSSDHNPVLFEVSLDNYTSPALSIYSFPNWYKFQDILTNTLPGNPRISNPNDIENAIKNFNECYNNALSNSSTF